MSELTNQEYRPGSAIDMARKERRFKVAFIAIDFFIEFMNACKSREFILLPETTEVPSGAEVVRVYEDLERQAFGVVICHWSFEIVPQGMIIPYLHDPFMPLVEFRRKPMADTFTDTSESAKGTS